MTRMQRRWRRFLRHHHVALAYSAGAIVANCGWLAYYQLGGLTHG